MRRQERARVWIVASQALLLCLGTTGCTVFGHGPLSCVDWVAYEDPAEATAAATVVVVTEGPTASAGTTDMLGVSAAVHSVHVDEVLKGSDVRVGEDLEVTSTPETCASGGTYPDGDPLDASGTLVLFLSRDADTHVLSLATPAQGVVAATADGEVPVAWPTS